ncbi:sulfatase [Lucifera butyrica]|uniref:Sulfatase n=1 Tax=Lucifera butyrica TaxID=1351585 RepID=A0A498RI90_9FIRM|nr:sulfatase [Lucifera butyrica]VBB08818.1 sulfatase [Lucifera butyrica]
MRTILVLMDTLKRDVLKVYNQEATAITPAIDSFAEESIVFDEHRVGSMPCMPARRDILTGRLDFLERYWGPIEPFDVTLPGVLRDYGVFTHITTDHHHYFRIGGENYCQAFNTWEFQRGQESDPWVSLIDDPFMPQEHYGNVKRQYQCNKTKFKSEAGYSTPKTFQNAMEWLEINGKNENFFLTVEVFDPHEPFDCDEKYLKMYADNYDGPFFDAPQYGEANEPDAAKEHLKRRYQATLSMTDAGFGRLIKKLKELNIYDETIIILTADHGFCLDQHGYWGKNCMHVYDEIARIPFIVHVPKSFPAVPRRVKALTQNIDIMPTVLDYLAIPIPDKVQGISLRSLIEGQAAKVRDYALYGYHSMAVNITDGEYTYLRAPAKEDNYPCYTYTAVPMSIRTFLGTDCADGIEAGRFLKHTNYPVFKIPVSREDVPFGGKENDFSLKFVNESKLYCVREDPKQEISIVDAALEKKYANLLMKALTAFDAPDEQFARLGLV